MDTADQNDRPRQKRRAERQARAFAPPGHFYSPVGDRAELRAYFASDHYRAQCDRVDAMLDYPAMHDLWQTLSPGIVPFPFAPTPGFRYHVQNNQLPYLDAALLSGMIRWLDPKRVVEIGSGWSTAVIIDTLDRMKTPRLQTFTTIDPDLSRIKALNPPDSVRMIAAPVQSVGLAPFAELEPGDVLFIDSSHVLKTGSDVHYEYLHILPVLKPGVIVHIHDIHYPLEYVRSWAVQENRSWNEVYLVDMMLTHGRGFEVMFFNDAFHQRYGTALAAEGDPTIARLQAQATPPKHQTVGSLWLRRLDGR